MNEQNDIKAQKYSAASNLLQLMSFTADKALELADANSVLGEPIISDGMTIIPVSKISAGFAGGGANMVNASIKKSNTPAGSGAKVTVTPLSFLVIADGEVKMVDVKASANETKSGIVAKIIEQFKKLKIEKKPEENKE